VNSEMEKVRQTKKFVIKWAVVLNLVLMAAMAVFFDWQAVLGIAVGGLISILNFQLLERALRKSVQFDPKKAAAYTFIQYLLRYGLLFGIFYITLQRPDINVVTTIVGVLTVKAVILTGNIFRLGVFAPEKKSINSVEGREQE